MDSGRFDDLTRNLAVAQSRRRVLKGLAMGVAGGFAALVSRRTPAAMAQFDVPDTCETDDDCVEQGFVNHVCDYGGTGRNITCTCPNGWAPCSNTLCCPPTADGSTCPPEGGTACVGDESPPPPPPGGPPPGGPPAGPPPDVQLPGNAQVPANPGPPADRGRPANPGKKK